MVSSPVSPPMQAGLAAGQLGHVRVLLLRHDRRPGRVGVVDLGPAELVRRPEHDLLTEPGQVHAEQRRGEAELGGEVPVADRVDRVAERGGEAQLGGDGPRIERQRRPGQGPGPERADRRPPVPVPEPARVAGEGLDVREQPVGQQHRLGVLQVRHPRRGRAQVPLRLVRQRRLQLGQPRHDQAGVIAQVQAQVGGDLVVTAAAGPQLAGQRADPLQQAAFQRGVHVLVGGGRAEPPLPAGLAQVVQRGQHPGQFGLVEQAGLAQHAGVGAGGQQVVGGEPPVELDADRQPGQGLGRA